MDYVVGGVAALISGNVTPNRPKKFKKALTPTKHQPSPNVTPKSEFVLDRSIFLSPTAQKKKAIVKKSPKRIFQNPDLDVTNEEEGNSTITSPKAVKVKKHLTDELNGTAASVNKVPPSPKSRKKSQEQKNDSFQSKNVKNVKENIANEITFKKKTKLLSADNDLQGKDDEKENVILTEDSQSKSPKKKRKKSTSIVDAEVEQGQKTLEPNEVQAPNIETESVQPKKKKKNNKEQHKEEQQVSLIASSEEPSGGTDSQDLKKKNKKNQKKRAKVESTDGIAINPNAVTNKDSDSEHESDDEMESENEEINKKELDLGQAEESSDEEEKPKPEPTKKEQTVLTEDEVKRTIFVGNVPFSKKCKKDIKKIFSQYGNIDTVRIRTVPVKDARVTPKMAVIKNELHPDKNTVNVYIKFADISSAEKALSANNTVLNDHHLRVSRSDSTGAAHDPKCSVFVGNIPFAMEDESLRAKFEKCGDIESVRIIRDKKTNAGKGFGYVNFASKDGVELALALTEEDLTVKNRIMRVKRCTQFAQKKIKPNKQSQGQTQSSGKSNFGRQNVNSYKGRFDKNDDRNEGAYRRLLNKRKPQDSGEGASNKRQSDQPPREKKARKEFVGMTAEKRKKHKFNKGLKKKKALSEVLTKK